MHNKNIWSPWRYEYLRNLKDEEVKFQDVTLPNDSNFIANYWGDEEHDQQNLVVFRNNAGIIFLNRYPYANGHLLVALGNPQPTLSAYEANERISLWELIDIATQLMHEKLQPQGLNIGINEGAASGAGLPQHLHAHVVPRWNGDTNFMATVGEVRVIPSSLEEMWGLYSANK